MLRVFLQYKCRYTSLKHPERWSVKTSAGLLLATAALPASFLFGCVSPSHLPLPGRKWAAVLFGFEDVVWREPQGNFMCPTLTRKGSSMERHCLSQHVTHLWARWQSGWSWTWWKRRKVSLPLKGPLSHCWEICFRKNRHLRWYPPRSGSHTTWTRATPGLTWA